MLQVNQLVGFGVGGGGKRTLYEIIADLGLTSNLAVCLDAAALASYDGTSQTWADLSGSSNDFFLGADGSATATDPTFNGVAGALTSSEYFSLDGGDHFQLDSATPSSINSFHKNNALVTLMAVTYRTAANGTYFSTASLTGTQWEDGAANGTQRFQVLQGASSVIQKTTSTVSSTSAWHARAFSVNEATGAGGGFGWLDGAYDQVGGSDTFDSTYSSPASIDSDGPCTIGARSSGSVNLPSGTRIACFAAWASALTKANLDAIWTALNGERTYV